jgi:hypothetical protein
MDYNEIQLNKYENKMAEEDARYEAIEELAENLINTAELAMREYISNNGFYLSANDVNTAVDDEMLGEVIEAIATRLIDLNDKRVF